MAAGGLSSELFHEHFLFIFRTMGDNIAKVYLRCGALLASAFGSNSAVAAEGFGLANSFTGIA